MTLPGMIIQAASDKRVNFHLTTPSVLYCYQTCNNLRLGPIHLIASRQLQS